MRRVAARRRQRGVAVITALLLTTLAVTIVASLFWQQQVQVRSMENQRLQLQTRWILRGALDLCRLILRQDGADSPSRTPVNGVWATPLAETRLDDYVERERLNGENFNATLSGKITDAQSRYNLANLYNGTKTPPGQLLVLQRLLTNLQLDPGLAQAVADQVARSRPAAVAAAGSDQSGSGVAVGGSTSTTSGATTGTGTAVTGTPVAAPANDGTLPMELVRVEDLLALSGFTPEAIERLRDYVIVLPEQTMINVNTASPELLAAFIDNLSVSEATAMANARKTNYYLNKGDFLSRLNGRSPPTDVPYDVKSGYFLVFSQVRLDRAALDAQSLLRRQDGTFITSVVWIREN